MIFNMSSIFSFLYDTCLRISIENYAFKIFLISWILSWNSTDNDDDLLVNILNNSKFTNYKRMITITHNNK